MIVIPAVDIKSGKCVRLRQGRKEDATVFSDDPVAMAGRWADEGAELIHVVELDGAFVENLVFVRAQDVRVRLGIRRLTLHGDRADDQNCRQRRIITHQP